MQKPSDELRRVQEVLRALLMSNDADDPVMLEAVSERVGEIELELGDLAGRQEMFELVMR